MRTAPRPNDVACYSAARPSWYGSTRSGPRFTAWRGRCRAQRTAGYVAAPRSRATMLTTCRVERPEGPAQGGRTVRPQLAREAWSTGAEVAGAPWQTRRPPPQPRSPPPPRSSGSPFIREVPKKGLPRRPLPVYAERNSTHRIAAHTGVTGVRLPRPQGRLLCVPVFLYVYSNRLHA